MTDSTLDQHMAIVGRIIAKFVSDGLAQHNIDSRRADKFLGDPTDKQTFEHIMDWMLDEGIVRARKVSRAMDGTMYIAAAQLTAKGLAIVKAPIADGDSIEKRVQSAGTDNSLYSKIGELVGSAIGSLTKSLGSG